MTEDSPSVDLLLQWKRGERDAEQGDVVSLEQPQEAEDSTAEHSTDPDLKSEESYLPPPLTTSAPVLEDKDDSFQWSEEREYAILEALGYAPEGAVSAVHLQLEAILRAVDEGEMSAERLAHHLAEVDSYLASRIAEEKKRPEQEDEILNEARADKLNALFSYQEASAAVANYGRDKEEMQRKVAEYALEQGSGFLLKARDLYLNEEPDWDED